MELLRAGRREFSSSCCPGSNAACRTPPPAAPGVESPGQGPRILAGASSVAASGARGAVDWFAVQVSDARPGYCRKSAGRRRGGGGGGVGVEVLMGAGGGPDSGKAAEIARSAFCPGTSCGTSLGWNLKRGVRRSAGKCTGGCGEFPTSGTPSKLASS